MRQQLRRLGDPLRVGDAAVEGKRAQYGVAARTGFGRQVEHVGRRQQHDRAWPPRGRNGEGHIDIVVDPLRPVDSPDPLRHRIEETEMVEFLEGVLAGLRGRHLLDKGDDRRRGLERLGQRWDQQGCGGPVLRSDDADPIGDLGVAVGHDSAGVLGAVRRLSNAMVGSGQVKRRGYALAKNDGDSVPLKGFSDTIRNGSIGSHADFVAGAGCQGHLSSRSPLRYMLHVITTSG